MEQAFAANGWSNGWRDGIFTYHHLHSIAHEVLGIATGEAQVAFGGPSGQTVTVKAGDVVVIPAGVAHRNMGQTDDLLVIGAYPGGSDYDTLRGKPEEHAAAMRAITAVPLPDSDPVSGREGPLRGLWGRTAWKNGVSGGFERCCLPRPTSPVRGRTCPSRGRSCQPGVHGRGRAPDRSPSAVPGFELPSGPVRVAAPAWA